MIEITRGDTRNIRFRLNAKSGASFDATGASFEAKFVPKKGGAATLNDQSKFTIDPDSNGSKDLVQIALSAVFTGGMTLSERYTAKLRVTQGSSIITFVGVGVVRVEDY